MSFERLTDEGPKGRIATFAVGKNPQPLGVAFVRSTNPKANCRLERTTYEMTALSATTVVRGLIFSDSQNYAIHHKPLLLAGMRLLSDQNISSYHRHP